MHHILVHLGRICLYLLTKMMLKRQINANIAAGIICSHSDFPIQSEKEISQIRIAFDGDAVIFSDESEWIYQE